MGNLLGAPEKPLEEVLKEQKRSITRSIRELDKQISHMDRSEKKVVADIKKHAQANQMGSVRVLAKDLVRTRKSIAKFYMLKTQLNAVSLQLQTVKSRHALGEAMKGVTASMRTINKAMNIPEMAKIMQAFERENAHMEMSADMMDDAMDAAFEADDNEVDQAVDAALLEIGIDLNSAMPSAPVGASSQPVAAGVGASAQASSGEVAREPVLMSATPSPSSNDNKGPGGAAPPPDAPSSGGGGGGDIDDLEARLRNLKK